MAVMELSAAIFFIGLYLFSNNIGFIDSLHETQITLTLKLMLLSLTAGIFSLIAFEDWKNHYISDLYIMALTYLKGFSIEPVTYQHLITLEEILLTEMVKNLQIKKVNTPFNHLQKDARQFSYRIEEVEKDFNKIF